MKKIYHLIDSNSLRIAESTGFHKPDSLATEGFIHLAYKEQLAFIIRHFLSGAEGIYLLELDESQIAADVVEEAPAGIEDDGNLYPHLYAPLNWKAVKQQWLLDISKQGDCVLPV